MLPAEIQRLIAWGERLSDDEQRYQDENLEPSGAWTREDEELLDTLRREDAGYGVRR